MIIDKLKNGKYEMDLNWLGFMMINPIIFFVSWYAADIDHAPIPSLVWGVRILTTFLSLIAQPINYKIISMIDNKDDKTFCFLFNIISFVSIFMISFFTPNEDKIPLIIILTFRILSVISFFIIIFFYLWSNKMTDKTSYHKTIIIIMSLMASPLVILAIILFFHKEEFEGFTYLTYILAGVYGLLFSFVCIKGINEIGPNQIGIILQWGKPIFQVGPGLLWLPLPIWRLHIESSLVNEEQYPEDENTNNGKITPIHITHGASQKVSSNALDNRITTAVSIVCRYKIVDLIKFITTIGNKDQLRRQIRDIVVTTVQVECAKETLNTNYSRLPEINSILKSTVEEFTSGWGIVVVNVLLQKIDLGVEIKDALTNVTTAQINQKANEYNAKKILYEGEARADVHKAFQYAKAEGYKIIAKKLNIAEPVIVYQIDKLAEMWTRNNADVNLYAGDMAEVFKMVTAFTKITSGNSDINKIE